MIGRRVAALCATALTLSIAACGADHHSAPAPSSNATLAPNLRVTSTVLSDGETVAMPQVSPRCGGQNRSPDLSWTPGPAGTAAYAVTMFDPDAPVAGGFWHWIAFDIPSASDSLPGGLSAASPDARQATNQMGDARYDGPCPPPGRPHRYIVTVYALKEKIDLPDGAPHTDARSKITADTLATGTLTAHFGTPTGTH